MGWESGKFKPRGNKVAELANIQKWDQNELRTKIAEKKLTQEIPAKDKGVEAEGKRPEEAPQEEAKMVKASAKRGGIRTKGRRKGRRRK